MNNTLRLIIVMNVDPILQIYDNEPSLIQKREKIKEKMDRDSIKMKMNTIGESDWQCYFD